VLTVAILGLLVLLAARLNHTETQTLTGRATVNDGDSITLGAQKIRLRGIDAPEFDQTCWRDNLEYPCGRRAREALVALIGRRPVSCSGSEHDKYDRLLATCSAGDAELNRGMVEAGWAVAYGDYRTEEEVARGGGAGLWAGSFDSPRDWRQMHGGMMETEHAIPGFLDWLSRLFRLS
jgi:endonuclease YncB( thermonuclease family)